MKPHNPLSILKMSPRGIADSFTVLFQLRFSFDDQMRFTTYIKENIKLNIL